MSIPVLKNQNSFDATLENQFVFTYQGSQVFKNRLVINKVSDNSEVYNQIQTTFQLHHTLSANTLFNNVQYSAKLSVFDKDNNESGFSNQIVFITHKLPIISVDVEQNQIVKNSFLPVNITYSSDDGELLNYWQLILYDSGNIIIKQTDQILATQSMGITINSLENSKAYSFEVIGTTVNGMIITTGKINFSVTYIEPNVFSKVILENIPDDGSVKIESHLIAVEGQTNVNPLIYKDNAMVDLTKFNDRVWFDNGFMINGDFTRQEIINHPLPYQIIDTCTNGEESLIVKYMYGDFEEGIKAYFLLEINNGVIISRIATNIFEPLDENQYVYLVVRRINNLWSIRINDYSVSINDWRNYNLTIEKWNNKNLSIEDMRLKGKLLLN